MYTPQHLGLIMDGNGRWARTQGLPRHAGHRAGLEHIRTALRLCHQRGIDIVSGYLWSTENWARPASEVGHIRALLRTYGTKLADELHAEGVRIIHSGSFIGLTAVERDILTYAVHVTAQNGPRVFNLVFNHGGRAELVQVVRDLLARGVPADDITEASISAALPTAGLPDIDLLIRTGGDQRASNFLVWQTVSAWFYSVAHYWPAFDGNDLDQALAHYRHAIERRSPTS